MLNSKSTSIVIKLVEQSPNNNLIWKNTYNYVLVSIKYSGE